MGFKAQQKRLFVTESSQNNRLAYEPIRLTNKTLPSTLLEFRLQGPWSTDRGLRLALAIVFGFCSRGRAVATWFGAVEDSFVGKPVTDGCFPVMGALNSGVLLHKSLGAQQRGNESYANEWFKDSKQISYHITKKAVRKRGIIQH